MACDSRDGGEPKNSGRRSAVPDAVIFFGHQSVGGNILDGIGELSRGSQQRTLPVEKAAPGAAARRPLLLHDWLGENRRPESKIDAFTAAMTGELGGRVDIAFFKFCYVDIGAGTEVEDLFARYRDAMGELRALRPGVVFVHVTVPLTTNPGLVDGAKNLVKRVLGRPLKSRADNVQRARYNQLVRETYGGKEPVFDLARLESTHPDGSRELFRDGGREHESLVPAYTDDGGHLNAAGRRVAAEALLEFLSALTVQSRPG